MDEPADRSATSELVVERSTALTTITLNRATARNSLSRGLLGALRQALDDVEADAACRVIVLRGTAGVFCTGMDFGEHVSISLSDSEAATADFMTILRRLGDIERVTVADIDGQAIGGGVGIAAACDLVIATHGSSFALPEVLWGLLPACVLPFLIRRVGFQRAYAMALTAQSVTAEQAERLGLVDVLSAEPQLWLRQFVARMSRVNAAAVGELKRYARALWDFDTIGERRAISLSARLGSSDEVQRGLRAFVEHRRFPWERHR
ncbi:MAG TPA: enoyl-CoA hydratase-related protein [Kofleriaceae bacterium]|nr:enoyl-CoA hydratase-related protein [Kofleriaceae bacterium]